MKRSPSLVATAVACAVALAGVGVGFAISGASPGPHDRDTGHSFLISNTISSSGTSQIPALLFPGVERYLWYTVQNLTPQNITVTDLHISSIVAPASCPLSELDVSATEYSGALSVGALSSASVAVPISLIETGTNQDSCEGTRFKFTFGGRAVTSEPRRTDVHLTTSDDPSRVGESVTYTAFVTTDHGRSEGIGSGALSGSITFFDGVTAICTNVALVATGGDSGEATCTPSPYNSVGNHVVTARFVSSNVDFSNSTSNVVIQVVTSSQPHCSGDGDRDDHGPHDSHDSSDSPFGCRTVPR